MKKLFGIICLTIFFTGSASACDICGCGVGSYYTGILPEFNKKILGLRYRFSSLRTHIGAGGMTSYLTTSEKFHTLDVWGGWTIKQKFRLMGYIPLNYNEKINQGNKTSRSGIGDIGVQGFYRVFDRRGAEGRNFISNSLWLGVGVKMPTGKYDAEQKDDSKQSANTFQLGTGTVDFTFNAMYDLRIQDFGINTTASYKLNTVNKEHYQYGNKFSSTLQAYYKIRVKNRFTVAPNAGLAFETASKDIDNKYTADVSGGNILLNTAGAEISFTKIAVGVSWQIPVSQHLAAGFVKAGNKGMVHISFML